MHKESEIMTAQQKTRELQNDSYSYLKRANPQQKVLFSKSAYIIPNKNHIFIDYPTFKQFGASCIQDEYSGYLMNLINDCLLQYSSFEIHANMQSFSITAAQKYNKLIYNFLQQMVTNPNVMNRLSGLYLYHMPKMVDSIVQLFSTFISNEHLRNKITIVQ